jgi:hypothetical protein
MAPIAGKIATSGFGDALAEIPTCALDEAGAREQRARYARLARSVSGVERHADAVFVRFDESLDREALDEALSVERECCPFFQFEFDPAARRLRAAVRTPDQLPALDAIARSLGAAHQAT